MNTSQEETAETPQAEKLLPPQSSPTDTSNWDDREFVTPNGRVVIETDQSLKSDNVITSQDTASCRQLESEAHKES